MCDNSMSHCTLVVIWHWFNPCHTFNTLLRSYTSLISLVHQRHMVPRLQHLMGPMDLFASRSWFHCVAYGVLSLSSRVVVVVLRVPSCDAFRSHLLRLFFAVSTIATAVAVHMVVTVRSSRVGLINPSLTVSGPRVVRLTLVWSRIDCRFCVQYPTF